MRRLALAVALLALCPGRAWAHGFAPALVEVTERGDGSFDVRAKRPADADGDAAGPTLSWGDDCARVGEVDVTRVSDAVIERSRWRCARPLAGRTVALRAEGRGVDTLLLATLSDGRRWSAVARAGDRAVTLPGATPRSAARALASYVGLGVEHIAGGVDHLLFVLGLLLLARGAGEVARTVTAFTLGHSVTLALSVLGWVSLRQAPVEAVIALSVALLAVEASRPQTAQGRATPWKLAAGFGLLHGFGFAGALREAGLPRGQAAAALAGFNLGVELGQLAFVALALGAAWVARRARVDGAFARGAAVRAMGAAATYWFLTRMVAVWG